MTVDEFRRELVGVPLCGTPDCRPVRRQDALHRASAGRHRDPRRRRPGGLRAVGGERRADLPPQRAGSARPAALRDLRARRPQQLPQQRRRRILSRALRERQVAGPTRRRRHFAPRECTRAPVPNLSYDPATNQPGRHYDACSAYAVSRLALR